MKASQTPQVTTPSRKAQLVDLTQDMESDDVSARNVDQGASDAMDISPAPITRNTARTEAVTQEPSEAQHAIDFLTSRCVTCRGPAADTMTLRPVVQPLADQLTAALNSMVKDATSMSALILGPPGSGKTLLVERCVASVLATNNMPGCAKVVGVVRLSGLLHTEERTAFQDIARQLCKEFGQEFSKGATFEQNLAFLRTMLATLHVHCKSVVFLLDSFEKFAHARGGGTKQQLLYNLLDVLQHAKVQAAVIGISRAQDVMECMEKRVRSRFSHRRMMLTGLVNWEVPPTAGPSTAPMTAAARKAAEQESPVTYGDTPCGVLQDILTLPTPTNTPSSAAAAAPSSSTAAAAGGASGSSSQQDSQTAVTGPLCSVSFVKKHNTAVATAMKDQQVKATLQKLFTSGITPRTLMCVARSALDAWEQSCSAAEGSTSSSSPCISTQHILVGIQSQLPQSQVTLLTDLSVLQLFLVVAMARLEGKGQQVVNFEMVWDECQSFRDARGVLAAFTSGAAWRAFEDIIAQNVAYWVSPGAEAAGRAMRYAGATLAVTQPDVQQALKDHEQCPNELRMFMSMEA